MRCRGAKETKRLVVEHYRHGPAKKLACARSGERAKIIGAAVFVAFACCESVGAHSRGLASRKLRAGYLPRDARRVPMWTLDADSARVAVPNAWL